MQCFCSAVINILMWTWFAFVALHINVSDLTNQRGLRLVWTVLYAKMFCFTNVSDTLWYRLLKYSAFCLYLSLSLTPALFILYLLVGWTYYPSQTNYKPVGRFEFVMMRHAGNLGQSIYNQRVEQVVHKKIYYLFPQHHHCIQLLLEAVMSSLHNSLWKLKLLSG